MVGNEILEPDSYSEYANLEAVEVMQGAEL